MLLLSTLITGKALEVYTRMSDNDCEDFDKLKAALLKAYDMNPNGFRRRFRSSRLESAETYVQIEHSSRVI